MGDSIKSTSNYNDFASLTQLARQSRAGSAGSLRETARQFESIFTRMMLKSMRSASLGDPIFGSDQSNFYRDMMDDQLSVQLTSGRGLGIADMLVRQLSSAGASSSAATPPAGRSPATGANGGAGATGATAAIGTATTPPGTQGTTAAATASGASPLGAAPTDAARAAFVQELWPSASLAGQELGVDPMTLIAHAALETGWGRSVPGGIGAQAAGAGAGVPCGNNLFGIKATGNWTGDSVSARTLEFDAGVPSVRTAKFRAYSSTADCFQDYVALLKDNPRYAKALGTGSDARAFGTALQQAGYATDPSYSSKLAAVAKSLKEIPPQPLPASQDAT